jgi:4-hydroxybenzoate polyprenyltransferase
LVFSFSSLINSAATLPWRSQLFGVLFAMHSHLLGQIMDVTPDRMAGRRTTAVMVGPVAAKVILGLFLVVESFLVRRVFESTLVEFLFLGGAVYFAGDAAFLFGGRSYPIWLSRAFLLGWNGVALATLWWIWSRGSIGEP